MIVQYTAAAIVNDLASRAMPATVYSIPTSANAEDHVSMGANEARHVLAMADDLGKVLALELMTAAQALDLRRPLRINSRLDELHAAMLRSAILPRLDRWLARRAEVAARYEGALAGSALRPIVAAGGRSAHHLFPVELLDGDVDERARELSAAGIGVGRHYPFLCPEMPACENVGTVAGDLPVARRIAARELSLPLHPQLDDAAVDRVITACRAL